MCEYVWILTIFYKCAGHKEMFVCMYVCMYVCFCMFLNVQESNGVEYLFWNF